MANFNLGQDSMSIVWPNLIHAAGMRRYGSLININPSFLDKKRTSYDFDLLIIFRKKYTF